VILDVLAYLILAFVIVCMIWGLATDPFLRSALLFFLAGSVVIWALLRVFG
jgi:hypothetical protein